MHNTWAHAAEPESHVHTHKVSYTVTVNDVHKHMKV